jgi:hypothetical protein
MMMALLTCVLLPFLLHTRNRDMPIRVYKKIHTGLNIQLGGEKVGLLSVAYQVGMAGMVKNDPRTPAVWHRAMQKNSLIMFITFDHSFLKETDYRKYNIILSSFHPEMEISGWK